MPVDNHTFIFWPRFHLVEQFVVVLEGILEVTLPVDDEIIGRLRQPDDAIPYIRSTRHVHRVVGDSDTGFRVPKKQTTG